MVTYDSVKEWIGLHSEVQVVGLIYTVKCLPSVSADVVSRHIVKTLPSWLLDLPCYDFYNSFVDVPTIKFLNPLPNFVYSGSLPVV